MPLKTDGRVRIMHVADIHFGAVDPAALTAEMEAGFLAHVEAEGPSVDLLVLGGDLFHRRVSMTDPTGKAVIEFMNRVMHLAVEHSFKVRVLRGTLTHDHNQLENFRWMESVQGYDFRILNHVESEELFQDCHVLWVPEEYFEDPDEAYEPFFGLEEGAQYDLVFLHGSVDFVDFSGHLHGKSQGGRYAPVFRQRDLERICRGPVLCGHVHNRYDHEGKTYYPGSYTRWCHGEEDIKCWIMSDYDLATGGHETDFYENEMAPRFVTVTLASLAPADVEAVAAGVATGTESGATVRVVAPASTHEEAAALAVLRERFAGDRQVKVEASSGRDVQQSGSGNPEFDFVLKRELDLPDTVARYIAQVHGETVPRGKVVEAISP
jgi:hypothetical protein